MVPSLSQLNVFLPKPGRQSSRAREHLQNTVLKPVFLVKLQSSNILLTQKKILKMNHLCCLLQTLLISVLSVGGFGEWEEIQAIFKGVWEGKLH